MRDSLLSVFGHWFPMPLCFLLVPAAPFGASRCLGSVPRWPIRPTRFRSGGASVSAPGRRRCWQGAQPRPAGRRPGFCPRISVALDCLAYPVLSPLPALRRSLRAGRVAAGGRDGCRPGRLAPPAAVGGGLLPPERPLRPLFGLSALKGGLGYPFCSRIASRRSGGLSVDPRPGLLASLLTVSLSSATLARHFVSLVQKCYLDSRFLGSFIFKGLPLSL